MKKVILAQARVAEDKNTKERVLWTTFIDLPSKGKNGVIWYPLKTEVCIGYCFGEDRHPEIFALLRKAIPGTLFGVTFGFNDRTNKPYIQTVELLKEGYTEDDIYREEEGNE